VNLYARAELLAHEHAIEFRKLSALGKEKFFRSLETNVDATYERRERRQLEEEEWKLNGALPEEEHLYRGRNLEDERKLLTPDALRLDTKIRDYDFVTRGVVVNRLLTVYARELMEAQEKVGLARVK